MPFYVASERYRTYVLTTLLTSEVERVVLIDQKCTEL